MKRRLKLLSVLCLAVILIFSLALSAQAEIDMKKGFKCSSSSPIRIGASNTYSWSFTSEDAVDSVTVAFYSVKSDGTSIKLWSLANAGMSGSQALTINSGTKVYGTATIYYEGGTSATITSSKIPLIKPVSYIIFSPTSISLFEGETCSLPTMSVSPSDATNTDVTFSSLNTTVATVDAEGNITAKSVGETAIHATADDGCGAVGVLYVKVLPDPASGVAYIVTQPTSTKALEGEKASATVEATGNGLTYEWYVKRKDETAFKKTSGTLPTYSMTMTQERDGIQVYCIVTDKYGNSVQSDTITFGILTPVKLKTPLTDSGAAEGDVATLKVDAVGDGLKYKWYHKAPSASSFSLAPSTTATYSLEMTKARHGYQAYCIITDKYGYTVQTDVVNLRVISPVTITSHPRNVGVNDGETASVTVSATGDELTYVWYVKNVGSSGFVKSDVKTDFYTVTMNQHLDGVQVFCRVTDKYGYYDDSNVATLKIMTPLKILVHPQDTTEEKDVYATYYVYAEGDGLTYRWYVRRADAEEFSATSCTNDTYTLQTTEARNGMQLYCIITDYYGNAVQSEIATMYLKTVAAIKKQPVSANAYDGQEAAVSIQAVGDGLSYRWYVKSPKSSTYVPSGNMTDTYRVTMNKDVNGTKLYCEIKDKYGNTIPSDIVTLGMINPAKITVQPKSVWVNIGDRAYTSLTATGDGLTYQWYFKAPKATSFKQISATSYYCNLILTEDRDGAELYCIVTDKYGNTAKSNTVTMNMIVPLQIITQPKSISAGPGEKKTISVVADGAALTYKWHLKKAGESTFTLTSCTSASYDVTMSADQAGDQLYCIITDEYGNYAQTNTVTLNYKAYATIVTQPKSVSVAKGVRAEFSVMADGSIKSYQWYFKRASESAFKKLSSTDFFCSLEMTESRDGAQLYCEITDTFDNKIKTNVVTMTLKTTASITTQPKNVYGILGNTATVSLKAVGDDLIYQWYIIRPGSASDTRVACDTNTYSFTMTEDLEGLGIYCIVKDKYGNTDTSNTVSVSVAIPLSITIQPKNANVPLGANANFSVSAVGSSLTYQWYAKKVGESSFSALTTSSAKTANCSIEMTEAHAGMQLYCKITDLYGNTEKTSVVTMTTKTTAKVTVDPKDAYAAIGETAKFSVTAIGDGLTYQWYIRKAGEGSFSKVSCTASSYSPALSNDMIDCEIYCVVKDKYGNTDNSAIAKLKKANIAKITTQPKNVAVDMDTYATVSLSADGDGLTYKWYFRKPSDSSFKVLSSTTSSVSLKMTDARDGSKLYCVVSDKFGNSVTSNTVTISKKVTFAITTQPKSASANNGSKVTFSVKASGNGLTYQWYVKRASASTFSKTSCTSTSYSLTMTDDRNGMQLYCIVTDAYGNTLKSDTVTMKQNAGVTITAQPKSVTVVKGARASFSVSAKGDGLTYKWYFRKPSDSTYKALSATGSSCSLEMTSSRDGSKLYCKITDAYGNSVTTNKVTMKMD